MARGMTELGLLSGVLCGVLTYLLGTRWSQSAASPTAGLQEGGLSWGWGQRSPYGWWLLLTLAHLVSPFVPLLWPHPSEQSWGRPLACVRIAGDPDPC